MLDQEVYGFGTPGNTYRSVTVTQVKITKEQNTIVHLYVEFEPNPMICYQMALIHRSPRPPPSIPEVNLASENGACNMHISLHNVENIVFC